MFTVKPYFADKFLCKADACSDTCCAGWEIDIDNETVCKYKSVKGDFGKKLFDGIQFADDVYSFRLKENERCWFLADNGLCDIYSNLGEESLCEICREHPRFYNFYDNAEEIGFGLCCEKSCELLFENDLPFSLLSDGEMSDEDYAELYKLREKCFEIVRNRDSDFRVNIKQLLEFASLTQNEYFCDDYILNKSFKKKDIFRNVAEIYSETESINSEWDCIISKIKSEIDNLIEISDKHIFDTVIYEKLISYIMYRHLIETAFDGNFIGGISFSVSAIILVHMLDCLCVMNDGTLTAEDVVNNVKLWSKQTEYSKENTDLLTEESVRLFFI